MGLQSKIDVLEQYMRDRDVTAQDRADGSAISWEDVVEESSLEYMLEGAPPDVARLLALQELSIIVMTQLIKTREDTITRMMVSSPSKWRC